MSRIHHRDTKGTKGERACHHAVGARRHGFLARNVSIDSCSAEDGYGSGFGDPASAGGADPAGAAEAALAGVSDAERDGVGAAESEVFAADFGFGWVESLSAKFPASRDAIPAAVLSGKRCTILS
jgi:hypothetical protein